MTQQTDLDHIDAPERPDEYADAPQAIMDLFQAYLSEQNKLAPPTHTPPFFLANLRHNCSAQRNVSKAITLKEAYVTASDVAAYFDARHDNPNEPAPENVATIGFDLDEWAMLYREGLCKRCKETCRSEKFRAVPTATRPPIEGRVARA